MLARTQQRLTVVDKSGQGKIRAAGVINEKPKLVELIVDGKGMALKREVEPHLVNLVSHVCCDTSPWEGLHMFVESVP